MLKARLIQIVGAKNSGKTTLIEGLVRELKRLGKRVGTVKHTSHDHSFDTLGSDSHRHMDAGSATTIILSPTRMVCHSSRPGEEREAALMDDLFSKVDVVLWEGQGKTGPPRIEVVAPDNSPRFLDDPALIALAADHALESDLPRFARSDTEALAAYLMKAHTHTEDQ